MQDIAISPLPNEAVKTQFRSWSYVDTILLKTGLLDTYLFCNTIRKHHRGVY